MPSRAFLTCETFVTSPYMNSKRELEEEWDLEPIEVNAPPSLNFETIEENYYNSNIDMKFVAKKYNDFMIGLNNK